jgi:hypothetical protein
VLRSGASQVFSFVLTNGVWKGKGRLELRKWIGLGVFFVVLLYFAIACAGTARADEEENGKSLFFLSPTVNWYFPTEQRARDAFGHRWFGVGVSVNLESLGFGMSGFNAGDVRLYPYFGYFGVSHGDNDAHLIPIGIEARWNLAQTGILSPYFGVGVAGYGVKFEDREAGVDTGWRGALGGRLMFGTDITKWFNLQVAYNIITDVEDYNLSGFSIQGKLRIYF